MRAFESTLFRSVPRGAALAFMCCLGGCIFEQERSAGVDDFPNSIYARVNGYLDEGKKAESLEAAPGTDSLLIRQSFIPPPVKKIAAPAALPPLARKAAGATGAACPTVWTISNKKAPFGTRVTVDTLIVCVDSLFLDAIEGNEHIVRGKSVTRDTATGRVEAGEFTDADDDGFLNPIPGGKSKARLVFLVSDQGVTERTEMVVGDGPDDDFATEADNLIYHLAWSKTRGADTLGAAAYTDADADSDGVVIDNAKPSLVDVSWYAQGPTEDDPTAKWARFRMRTWAVYGVKGTRPIRFSAESESGNGRRNRAEILALDGSETFDLEDTVLARFQAVGTSPADTVDTLRTTLRMKVGDFDDKTDDTTFAIKVEARKKLGEEVFAVFEFLSDRPISHGQEPEAGTLTLRVEYADATTLDVQGTLKDKTVDLTATLRDKRRLHAVWDPNGKRIALEYFD